MTKKNNLKILKFPNNAAQLERQVEAILFAAEEPLDIESIQEKLNTKANISKILESLENQYKKRGVNLVCIAKKWLFKKLGFPKGRKLPFVGVCLVHRPRHYHPQSTDQARGLVRGTALPNPTTEG